ncbi:MAG: 3-deoxy-D-manno-octulosonic-acid transferase [Algoriphagus sp.]|jgi:3-deoxy-D-manno-octulosonic-acid transferase
MKWFYRLGIFIIRGLLPLAALFNSKVARFLEGRIDLFEKLDHFRSGYSGPVAWFHVSSLGEYEQAKPVIEVLKNARPELQIALSFFSPSGYDQLVKKSSTLIDFITYIPLDSKRQAERFVAILKPVLVFFVKYDLWYHHVQASKRLEAELYLISASFRPNQIYFSRFPFFQNLIKSFDVIFTQNKQSVTLLESIGYSRGIVAGDTRFDRVIATALDPKQFPEFLGWAGQEQVLVAGSVWEEDMQLLIPEINTNPQFRWIIAPHSLDPEPMNKWMSAISQKAILYSGWDRRQTDARVILVDNIGMLSSLYQFGKVAYVGGAFGKGLHNILEPIGFKIPVLFGKLRRKEKFPEAGQSREEGCGFEVENSVELKNTMKLLEDPQAYSESKAGASQWLEANQGASERILKEVLKRYQS